VQIGLGELLEQLERDLHPGTINPGAQAMQERRFAMKTSVLFALIVIGAPTQAAAQPKNEETSGRVSLSDKPAPSRPARQPGDWVELASATPAKHGKEFVVVGKDAGTFGKLRLDAGKGTVIVLRVKVYFDDGTSRGYMIDQRLVAKRRKSTVVDLKTQKPIDRIVVSTETYTNGEYAVYGASTSGVVAGR
jgi:hypothetical protein